MRRVSRWRTSDGLRGSAFPLLAALSVTFLLAVPATLAADEHEEVDLGAYAGPVRLEAPAGIVVEVESGTRTWRLAENVEMAVRGDHLVIVNDVSMDTYLEGLAEVPVRWPSEALKAQVVAARTYAWRSIQRGVWEGYDICATVACQVFHGREVVESAGGERWAEAVAATSGEVLTFDGEPILARYFSTSGGHTRPNEEVFPSDGAYPYLVGIEDPEDEVSPLHEWQIRFTRDEMDAILRQGQQLSAAAPAVDLVVVPAGGGRPDRVRVTGEDGTEVTVNAATFRGFVSRLAPETFPDRFPTRLANGRRMPETLPSSRMTFTVTDDEVVIDGRGYGHGVGMSQYGAYGRALDGATYDEILAAYYNGLEPVEHADVPERLRVGLTEEATEVSLRADGPVRVLAGGETITARGLGSWRVEVGPDRTLRLAAPPGYGAPLVVADTTAAHEQPSEVHTVQLETVVNKPSELTLAVHDGGGDERARIDLGVVEPGRHDVTWHLDDADGAPLAPGAYEVALRATDETGEEVGAATALTIAPVEPPRDGPRTLLGPSPGHGGNVLVVVAAGILGVVAGLFAAGRSEERR